LNNAIPNEPQDALPVGIASSEVLSVLEITLKEKTNKTVLSGNSIRENDERLNRVNFFFKNIRTSMTYMDVFISISTMYPLIQLNTTTNAQKLSYICAAGNVLIHMNNINRLYILDTSTPSSGKFLSLHLCFEKKVNFKHKFLNNIFPGKDLSRTYPIGISCSIDLKISDYLLVVNGDEFNAEIKLLAKQRYIESTMYMPKKGNSSFKKGKYGLSDGYRQKQSDIASTAFNQESLPGGLIIL
jgi:hypothetical protein